MTWGIINAELLDGLRDMPDNTYDGVFCDPPYELGFMGKSWDSSGVAFQPGTWAEVLRVCKPGAHLLAFGGSRTFHRLVCAVEDAGWEIRDALMWVYGSGFPKSLDVSKAIDKERVEDREPVRRVCRFLRAAMEAKTLKSNDLAPEFNCHPRLVDHWAARDTDSQPALPKWDQWLDLKHLLGLPDDMDAEVWRLNGRKGHPGEAWQTAEVVDRKVMTDTTKARAGFSGKTHSPEYDGSKREVDIKAPAPPAAQLWQGYGTALKPAYEPIILARKPLDGTVANNVQKWGCGALWIDGGRVGTEVLQMQRAGQAKLGTFERANMITPERTGRWPANLLHDGSSEVLAGFPESKGQRGDSGSASRFFYCAKANQSERNAGCGALPAKTAGEATGDRKEGSAGLNSQRAGAGRTSGSKNHHPTVKPLDLCRYLASLILPPAGRPQGPRRLLVPFSGSGSEMIGALRAGWDDVTGIEREAEYVEIARARLEHWSDVEQKEQDATQSNPRAAKQIKQSYAQCSMFDCKE